MSLSISIKKEHEGINLNHFANLAEEYFGQVIGKDEYTLNLIFMNHSHAQNFRKTIVPYFSGCYV